MVFHPQPLYSWTCAGCVQTTMALADETAATTCLEFSAVSSGGTSSAFSAENTPFSSSSDISQRTKFTVSIVSGPVRSLGNNPTHPAARLAELSWFLEYRKEDGTIVSEWIGGGWIGGMGTGRREKTGVGTSAEVPGFDDPASST